MDEIDLKTFADTAPPEIVDEFVNVFCSGSRNQLYQLTGRHRFIGSRRARAVAAWFQDKGFNVPLHQIRPMDFEGAA